MTRLTPFEEALELARAGRKGAARQRLEAILSQNPRHIDAWLLLASVANTPQAASDALRQALQVDPANPKVQRAIIRRARRILEERGGAPITLPNTRLQALRGILAVLMGAISILAIFLVAINPEDIQESLVGESVPEATLPRGETCEAELEALAAALLARCGSTDDGQACLLNGVPSFERTSGDAGAFNLPGDRIRLADVNALGLSGYDGRIDRWGLARLNLPQASALLLGETQLYDLTTLPDEWRVSVVGNVVGCEAMPPSGVLLQAQRQIRFQLESLTVEAVGSLHFSALRGGRISVTNLAGIVEITAGGVAQRLLEGETFLTTLTPEGRLAGNVRRETLPPQDAQSLARWARAAGLSAPWADDIEAERLTADVEAVPQNPLTGEVIFFSADRYGNDDLFVVNTEGRILRLTDSPANERDPSLSPDGRSLVFSSDAAGNFDIYVWDLATDETRQLTLNQGQNTQPSWGGDHIIYTSDAEGTPQIWMMGSDGTGLQALTSTEGGTWLGAMQAPDGALAYSLREGGIVIQQGDEEIILPDPFANYPAWAADGETLIYQSSIEGGGHLYRYHVADESIERIETPLLSGELMPAVSGENQLAFVSQPRGIRELFLQIDDERVLNLAAGVAERPAWGVLSVGLDAPTTRQKGHWVSVSGSLRSDLYDVDFDFPDSGLAVGENAALLRFDEGVWRRVDLSTIRELAGEIRPTLRGVSFFAPGQAWAVGDEGTILRRSLETWTRMRSPTDRQLNAVDGRFIVGERGTILMLNDGEWALLDSPVSADLLSVRDVNPDEAWITGAAGTLLRWNGETWREAFHNMTGDLMALDFNAAGDNWLASDSGIWGFEQGIWSRARLHEADTLNLADIAVLPDGSAWAVGQDGALLYAESDVWTVQALASASHLTAVDFPASDVGWAVGMEGELLQFVPDAVPIYQPRVAAGGGGRGFAGGWSCFVLQNTRFYTFDLIFEPSSTTQVLIASLILPQYGNTVVLLEGEVLDDESAVLRETEILYDGSGGRYRVMGEYRLRLDSDDLMHGTAFADGAVAAEIPHCAPIN